MKRTDKLLAGAGEARQRELELLAAEAILFLASDHERLGAFLALTGTDPGSLRTATGDPAFCRGLLAYLANDEAMLIDFAGALDQRPEALGRTILGLTGGETDF